MLFVSTYQFIDTSEGGSAIQCLIDKALRYSIYIYQDSKLLVPVFYVAHPLVTQPMLQRQPNCMELRSMDSYIQIFVQVGL